MTDPDRLYQAIKALRSAVGGIQGVMIASSDGLMLAHDISEEESPRTAAMAATALGLGRRIVQVFEQGQFEETLTRGSDGYLVVYAAGNKGVLAVVAPAKVNLGLLHHEARRVAAHIADIIG
ncbi:MAG TPA: roadblock/LC7 domain-containing protein [Actinomycetota bacterium]|nr:roadblock/LC7 domain-containing protein [Actinomycetota bacterium]